MCGSTPWLKWGLLGGMVSLFCVWGPWETLVPFVVTDQMSGTEFQLALVFGAGGVGLDHRVARDGAARRAAEASRSP